MTRTRTVMWSGIALALGLIIILLAARAWLMSPLSVDPTTNPVGVDRTALKRHITYLSTSAPPRSIEHIEALNFAGAYIEKSFQAAGHTVVRQPFQVQEGTVYNLSVHIGPATKPRIVIGAHYDVCGNQPGADDNASGVAGLLELARLLKDNESLLQFHFELVAFTLEEPPYFGTDQMGSAVHAKSLHDAGVDVALMVSLEMIGYFSDEPDSQSYPVGLLENLYPTVGNFIALVGNPESKDVLERLKKPMLEATKVPLYSINAPSFVEGVDFSDHRSYWTYGYPAVMLTDTALFRNPHYHQKTDTIETLDIEKMALVIEALAWGLVEF